MGADEYGFYLDLDGEARYVYRHHFEYLTALWHYMSEVPLRT